MLTEIRIAVLPTKISWLFVRIQVAILSMCLDWVDMIIEWCFEGGDV